MNENETRYVETLSVLKLKRENTLYLNYIKMLTGIDFSIDDVNILSNVLTFLYIQVSRKFF